MSSCLLADRPDVRVTVQMVVEEEKAGEDVRRFTRSMAQTSTPLGPSAPPSTIQKVCTSGSGDDAVFPPACGVVCIVVILVHNTCGLYR